MPSRSSRPSCRYFVNPTTLSQVEDEEVKKLLASSIKSKKKNKPKKKRPGKAANGTAMETDEDPVVKAKEQEEAAEGIRAL